MKAKPTARAKRQAPKGWVKNDPSTLPEVLPQGPVTGLKELMAELEQARRLAGLD